MSPFYALYGYNLELHIEARDEPGEGGVLVVMERVQQLKEERAALEER